MSSTVTTATATTVTTATLFGTFSLIVILALLVFMIKKEIASSSDHPRAQALSRVLNIAIVPLMFAFSMIAMFQVADILA